MIRIYNSYKYFEDTEILVDNEEFFSPNVKACELSTRSIDILKKIDGAEIIDKNIGTIKTKYGVTNISSISTGCKTILNYIYLTENPDAYPQIKAIEITECGVNAMEELFKQMEQDNSNMAVILRHKNKITMCENRDYLVNGNVHMTDLFRFRLEA